MAALTESADRRIHAATSTTVAEAWGLNKPVKYCYITNRDTDPVFCTLISTEDLVADDTGVTVAVASADESFVIPPGKTRCVFRSARKLFLRGSIIGNASDYDVEGSDHPLMGDFD